MKASLFETKKVTIETLGEYLQSARGNLKLSFLQVHRLTQIPQKFLEALERSEYASLPADVYVKGFLKSLAGVYGADPDQLIKQYDKERGLERTLRSDPLTPSISARFLPQGLVVTPKIISISLVVLGSLLSVGYLIWQIRSVSAPPQLTLDYPVSDVAVNTRNILLRGTTESGARVFVNGQEVAVDESGEFREVINLLEGSNTLQIRAGNKFGKTSEVMRSVLVSIPQGLQPGLEPPKLPTQISLRIRIGPKDTWLKVITDGSVKEDRIIAAGNVDLEFTAEKELTLSCGNAASTRIVYNGQDLGVLGKEGEVLSNIRFTAP